MSLFGCILHHIVAFFKLASVVSKDHKSTVLFQSILERLCKSIQRVCFALRTHIIFWGKKAMNANKTKFDYNENTTETYSH